MKAVRKVKVLDDVFKLQEIAMTIPARAKKQIQAGRMDGRTCRREYLFHMSFVKC